MSNNQLRSFFNEVRDDLAHVSPNDTSSLRAFLERTRERILLREQSGVGEAEKVWCSGWIDNPKMVNQYRIYLKETDHGWYQLHEWDHGFEEWIPSIKADPENLKERGWELVDDPT